MYEDTARDANRGHAAREVAGSSKLMMDAGFKSVAHMAAPPNVRIGNDTENPPFYSVVLNSRPTLVIHGAVRYKDCTPDPHVEPIRPYPSGARQ